MVLRLPEVGLVVRVQLTIGCAASQGIVVDTNLRGEKQKPLSRSSWFGVWPTRQGFVKGTFQPREPTTSASQWLAQSDDFDECSDLRRAKGCPPD